MAGQLSRQRGAGNDQHRSDRVGEAPPREHFLDRHDDTERRHPETFITPTANITSIIAQQQPRQ